MNILLRGQPIPLKRHRHTKTGRTYNSQNKEMNAVAQYIKSQCDSVEIEGPLRLKLIFGMKIPQSYSVRRIRSVNGQAHFIKPDLDNLIKFISDCIVRSGIVKDDSQFAQIEAYKMYDLAPNTRITIEHLKD